MSSPVEQAVRTYIRAVSEREPELRLQLLEQSLSVEVRLVSRSREFRGRAAVAEMLTRFWSDPENVAIRVLSAIDAGNTTFRVRAAVERRDGALLEAFDAGEIDAEGKIALILTFAGPLADAAPAQRSRV